MIPLHTDSLARLAELNQRVRHDLALLNYPPVNWVHAQQGASDENVSQDVADVVILGGGMCGLAAAFCLLRLGIGRLRIFDRSDAGREGPWSTFARMETLRSPKHLTGPATGIPSLTFRAWFEARFGEDAWNSLNKIPRLLWMDYLIWYRTVLALPVENNVEVTHIGPAKDARVQSGPAVGLLQLHCRGLANPTVFARKVVLATGRAGQGTPALPPWIADVPQSFWAHSSDAIDFASLHGKKVAVIGAGASAMDNAAEALEAGAAEVRILIRRSELPRVNKLMGVGHSGFTHGYTALSDAWRWRIIRYSNITRTPPPRASMQRVSRHGNAYFHMGHTVIGANVTAANKLLLTLAGNATLCVDYLILGTGFTIDMHEPHGLIEGAEHIATWSDCYAPPADEQDASLGRSPYLGRNFQFEEKLPNTAPWLRHLYGFNHAATLSLGKISGDIPGVSEGARHLASGIAAALYTEDIERHWDALQNYDTSELAGDEWSPTPLPASVVADDMKPETNKETSQA